MDKNFSENNNQIQNVSESNMGEFQKSSEAFRNFLKTGSIKKKKKVIRYRPE